MSEATQNDNQDHSAALEHAKEVIHAEEVGDFYRTARSGVQTKLADVRSHDHGQQKLAAKHIVHQKEPNDVTTAVKVEHAIEHVHEHRSLLSGFTL